MATYLVTGGAGFIGSHVVEELVSRGERVRVVDSLVTGRRENLAHVADVDLRVGDLAEPAVADRATTDVDYVVHLAAIPSVPRSVAEPIATNHANVTGTLSLLVAAQRHAVKRVVFASSSSVYGDAATLPKQEDMPPAPLSPYALQKLIGEQYGKLFFELYGLETVAVRYFNVFGPRQDPSSPYSGVISQFAQCLSEHRQPTIYGDGAQTRDFTYVRNVVDGTLRACLAPRAAGQVINVSCGGRISLNALYRMMRDQSGSDLDPVFSDPRVGDVRDSQADITRARELLDYEPTVFLEEGLQRTLAWYQTQRALA
ncbi:MAG: SDR family oxidoreductase [Vicinamibacterales bacterium]|jgi:nucleoside-diphosphate-sugar epimerase|nr:SDR family oxidoreductase [Vicinamibacterales bacterium]